MSRIPPVIRPVAGKLSELKDGTLRRKAFDGLPVSARALVRRAIQKEPLFPRQPHLVTVIVPVYNVEDYLHDCLRSIVNQVYTNLEIIIVDDGSTDGSASIAEEFGRNDSRIKLIRQPNAGLGAARNAGMRSASGEFVVFADSDDIVPPNAYRTMLDTLDASGSDFVVGSYYRMTDLRQYTPKWVQDAHSEPIIGATHKDFMLGLANVFAWNKMFRRSFIDRIGLTFPEGIRYEDQLPITRAYIKAKSFDVIPDKLYKWRIRFDGTSITQNKGSYDDVRDRVKVVSTVYDYVNENADAEFRDYWIAKVMGMDLIPYISESLHADDDYRERIHHLIGLLEPHVTDAVLEKISVKARCALYAFKNGTPDELGHVMLANNEIGAHLPTELREGGVYFTPNYPEEVSLTFPDSCLKLSDDELRTEHAISRIKVSEQSLILDGWAFLRNIDLDRSELPNMVVYAESVRDGRRIEATMSHEVDHVSRAVRSKWPNYDSAAFSAEFDLPALDYNELDSNRYLLMIQLEQFGIKRNVPVTNLIKNGSAGRLESVTQNDGKFVKLEFDKNVGLQLGTGYAESYINNIETTDRGFRLSVASKFTEKSVLNSIMGGGEFSNLGEESAAACYRTRVVKLEPRTVLSRVLPHKAYLSLFNGLRRSVLHVSEKAMPGESEYSAGQALRRSRKSTVEYFRSDGLVFVNEILLEGLYLTVSGTGIIPNRASHRLLLESKSRTLEAESVDLNGTEFTARFKLESREYGRSRRLPYDGYLIKLVSDGRNTTLMPGRELGQELPFEVGGSDFRLRMTRTRHGMLWLTFSFSSRDDESGTLNQARLQRWHREADFEVLKDSVFFQSYLGENATDSALAIHRELHRRFPELKLYWGVTDKSVQLPEGGEPIVIYTREWFEMLSRAEYLVNDIYFFSWFVKRPYQTYLQTWHGTPLKKIGRSYWEDRNREPVWIDRMDRQAAGWDYLVTPNSFCTEKFTEEFRYNGTVLEVGYPRNDVLALPPAGLIDEVKKTLSIGSNKKVVLYAPTWRDSQSAKAWVAEIVTFIDLQKLTQDLGDDYVVLVRGHGHNARAGSTVGSSGSVIDVTFYPEINDLYLIADLAITDYSSVMFDFAVTRKPMLFFAPDLQEYAEGVRGFYMDYESTVPGPVVFEADEVAGAITDLIGSDTSDNPQYQNFVERFCSNDDGHAASRVVDEVWQSRL